MDEYSTWEAVPDHLMTRKKLREAGLRLARGQQPVAQKTGGYGPFDLYDSREAVAKRQMSEAQKAALEKAKRQAVLNSRCARCGEYFEYLDRSRIAIEDVGNGAYICFMCKDKALSSTWARLFLATPGALILDTETTGLDDQAEIVEVAIIDVTGTTIINTLVKPSKPIPDEAVAIHGITNDEIADADTWDEIDDSVSSVLAQAPAIAIYNAEYDQRLIYQSRVAAGLAQPGVYGYWWDEDVADPEDRLINAKISCAMNIYAAWYGEWSNYHKSYKWQALDGGHRALGDCLATLEKIKEMAND